MEREKQIIELDDRPHLRKKLEPFQLIMETVKSLKNDDIFVLHATFKPTPLLGLMKVRGYVHKVERIENDHWIISFVNKKYKQLLAITETEDRDIGGNRSVSKQEKGRKSKAIFLDNRGLEPPQPMMRTLAALDRSRLGEK